MNGIINRRFTRFVFVGSGCATPSETERISFRPAFSAPSSSELSLSS
jgi:hypothetical protein